MTPSRAIEHARAAAAKADWRAAYDVLAPLDADGLLPASELPFLADVAYAAGHLDVTLAVWERVHAERARAGDRLAAAGAAVQVAKHLILDTALMAPARAWIVRAERFLDGAEDNPVFAWLAVAKNYERLLSGDFEAARAWARRAIEVGSRCDPAAAAVGQVAEARSLILEGNVREGLRQLDEGAGTLFGGDFPPIPAGLIYCELVCAAQGVAQYDLAEEWTSAMERWSPNAAQGSIHGRCRIHRAEILRLRGALSDAEAEAVAACEELRPYLRRELGWPLTELGMIRLRRGDLAGAEETFLAAHEAAWDPHPGFALLRLARGDVAGAVSAIQDALDHPLDVPSKERPPHTDLRRVPLLEAKVEIAVVAGDLPGARAAADELDQLAARFESKAFTAMAALARARVRLADGDPQGARTPYETAIRIWNEIGAPYETSVARIGLAQALRAAGQLDRAELEAGAARSVLERIGADPRITAVATATDNAQPAPKPAAPAVTADAAPNIMRLEGDTWFVAFGGQHARVRDLKGLRYLAVLFREPSREIHALQLVGHDGEASARIDFGDAGAMLDSRAKEMYRRRLSEIEDDIESAKAMADLGRAAQAEREREFLVRELSRAVGIGGRDRVASSASERARVSATRAVRQAIDRIREHHATLAEHLDHTVKTGTFFCYQPDPRVPVSWLLD